MGRFLSANLVLFSATPVCLCIPTADAAAQATPVVVAEQPVLSPEDYPARASRSEIEGWVVVDVAVSSTGTATACTPVEVQYPGYGFEDASCRVWNRARFAPARDAAGTPVPGVIRRRVEWVLEDTGPVPAAPVQTATQDSASHPPFQCQTPVTSQTDFIWQIDKGLMHMTNLADGSRYTISDIRGSSGQERIMAHLYTPTYGIEVDLFVTLTYDEFGDAPPRLTVHRQVLSVGGPLGSGQNQDRYEGRCWPVNR